MEEQAKHNEKSLNVIYLNYLGSILTENDLKEFKNKLDGVGLELSCFDREGIAYMSMDKIELVSYIVIPYPLIIDLINGMAPTAMWDAIKFVTFSVWEKIRGKTHYKVTSQTLEEKEDSFVLQVSSEKNTFNMKLKSNVGKKLTQCYLDKALDFYKEIKRDDEYKHSCFVEFDTTSNKWVKTDDEVKIRKKLASQNNDANKASKLKI